MITVLLITHTSYVCWCQEYINAGATVIEDMSEAPVILGVKQVPIDMLQPEKTYVFFSHTIKAQEDNMALLDAILEKVRGPRSHNTTAILR